MKERIAVCSRQTKETTIQIKLNLDGTGKSNIHTGIGFFDHMLAGFAKHGLFDLEVSVKGDLEVDCHHTIEDTGIVIGEAIKKALGEKAGIKRYGYFLLPMDETLAMCNRFVRKTISCISGRFFGAIYWRYGYGDDKRILLCDFLQRHDESSFKDYGKRKSTSYV